VGLAMPRNVAIRAVRSYRTISPLPAFAGFGGIFSVALSIGSRRPGVTWHPALWSPDFPPPGTQACTGSGCLANSGVKYTSAHRFNPQSKSFRETILYR